MPELTPPELKLVPSDTSEWKTYEGELYAIFKRDFLDSCPTFLGLPVHPRRYPEDDDGKWFSFTHVITEGKKEEERTPDYRRCERIEWIKWIIANHEHPKVSYWESRRGSERNYVIWCEELEFAVIVSKRSSYFVLKSAYTVTGKHKIAAWTRDRDAARKT